MRNHEAASLLARLYNLTGYDHKVSYAIARIRPQLRKLEQEGIQRRNDVYSEASKELQKEFDKIHQEFSHKDENGKAKTIRDGSGEKYDIANVPAHEAAIARLKESHKDALAFMEGEEKALTDWLNQEAVLDRYKLPLALVETKELVDEVTKVVNKIKPPTSEFLLLSEVIEFTE